MSGRTNVLSVIHFPIFGGPMNRNALVAKELAPRGYHTQIVLPDEPGNSAQRFAELGIDTIQLPLHRIRARPNPAFHVRLARSFRAEVARLRQEIRDRDIDVVLINGSANPHGALAAQLENTALVWQLLDTFPPPVFLHAAMPMVRRWSDVIMTNGMTVAAMHPGIMQFEGPLITFGPCLPIERFTRDPDTAAKARAELGLAPDDVVVGTVNNINRMKGHLTFVRAAARLRATHPARFVILGAENDPPYTQELLAEARALGLEVGTDLIIRDGGSRVAELAQAFDLFWLTSEPRSEGMSTSLAEAQCLGIPVVSTRTGSVHECMRDGETGFLVPPHDIDGIVQASTRLLDDDDRRAEFSRAAAAFVRRSFSARATADKHAEAYDAAIRLRAARTARRGSAKVQAG